MTGKQLIAYYSIEPDGTISEPIPLMMSGVIGGIYNYGLRKYNGGYQFFFRSTYQGSHCYCSIFIPQSLNIIPQEPVADMYMHTYSVREVEVGQEEFPSHDPAGAIVSRPIALYNVFQVSSRLI